MNYTNNNHAKMKLEIIVVIYNNNRLSDVFQTFDFQRFEDVRSNKKLNSFSFKIYYDLNRREQKLLQSKK